MGKIEAARLVTCLTKNNVPEIQIIQLAGHKNLQKSKQLQKGLIRTTKGYVWYLKLIQDA